MKNETALREGISRGSAESARRQIEFGQQLVREKQTCIAEGRIWKAYVRETFEISRERADELIRIGRGVISVEKSRETKRSSQRLSRMRNNPDLASKLRVIKRVERSTRLSGQARLLIAKSEFSKEDKAEMWAAISNTIASWQVIFDVLR